jgi:hypothetical protein
LARKGRLEGLGTQAGDPRWDWVFVTRNSIDFRGPTSSPGKKGQYANVGLHAGLICINGPVGMDLNLQLELFAMALDEIERDGDLVNQVLEVRMLDGSDEVDLLRYKLPVV